MKTMLLIAATLAAPLAQASDNADQEIKSKVMFCESISTVAGYIAYRKSEGKTAAEITKEIAEHSTGPSLKIAMGIIKDAYTADVPYPGRKIEVQVFSDKYMVLCLESLFE